MVQALREVLEFILEGSLPPSLFRQVPTHTIFYEMCCRILRPFVVLHCIVKKGFHIHFAPHITCHTTCVIHEVVLLLMKRLSSY